MKWITLTGTFTNLIRIDLDNIYMTNKEIEKLAEKISHLVLEGILQGQEIITEEDEEQELLAELAALMTQLDFNLKIEDYNKCEELKTKIIKIENKLNKFK